MSDYTPTTEQIKQGFSLRGWLDEPERDGEKAWQAQARRDAEFDRWLAEHDRQVTESLAAERDEFKRLFSECHPIHLDGVQRARRAEDLVAQMTPAYSAWVLRNSPNVRDALTLIARDVHLYDGGPWCALSGTEARRIADAILARYNVSPKEDA